jgi:hypothetical protein
VLSQLLHGWLLVARGTTTQLHGWPLVACGMIGAGEVGAQSIGGLIALVVPRSVHVVGLRCRSSDIRAARHPRVLSVATDPAFGMREQRDDAQFIVGSSVSALLAAPGELGPLHAWDGRPGRHFVKGDEWRTTVSSTLGTVGKRTPASGTIWWQQLQCHPAAKINHNAWHRIHFVWPVHHAIVSLTISLSRRTHAWNHFSDRYTHIEIINRRLP